MGCTIKLEIYADRQGQYSNGFLGLKELSFFIPHSQTAPLELTGLEQQYIFDSEISEALRDAFACVVEWMDEALTETQRTYIREYYLEGRSTCEITKERGVNRSTVSRSLQRSIKRAKVELAQEARIRAWLDDN